MIGQQIQNYAIISQLGQGGMGTVYKAVDNVLGREVALKMLNTLMINQPQVLDRFKKEAQVLARLLHPNIAVIYNLIEQGGQHFMVMEYVEGKNLDDVLRQHKVLPYQMVVLVFMQALEGLHHAHKKGIFHRDIKPSNLILTPYGTVKLMDFGIAKVAGEQRMTQVNKVIGTIEFLAPEIIEGKEPSVASDIYAAGVTMYELLSGKLPFESSTDYNLMQEILKKKPISLDKLNNTVPKALSNIVMKALEKKPENRFTDAGAFQHALAAAFPELRGIDLGTLNMQLEAAAAPPLTQVISQPRKDVNNDFLQATRMETLTKPNNILNSIRVKANDVSQNIRQKYLASIRSRVIAGLILLLLILFLGFSIFSKHETPTGGLADNNQLKENLPENKKDINTGNNSAGENIILPPNGDNPQIPTNPPPGIQTPINEQEVNNKAKKEQAKKDKEKRDRAKKEQETKNQEKREQPPPVVVETKPKPSSRTIEINRRVEVHIRLADNIRSVDNLSEGQTVHFVVTEPVEYENETIIRRGAQVNASIKGIGRVLIAITINSIESAGGRRINLERVGLTKSKRDFPEGKTYSIALGRGVMVYL